MDSKRFHRVSLLIDFYFQRKQMAKTLYCSLSDDRVKLSPNTKNNDKIIKTFNVQNYYEALTYLDVLFQSHPWNLILTLYTTDERGYSLPQDKQDKFVNWLITASVY